ncbi:MULTISPECIES: TIR domain-containing protein [unclassified Streptomyces]|uniref:TIR domain-containing protein n=1 Tax=unclassified Streptomyces TaxID=2593676 RepID=UPI0006982708|nr:MULTISPECIES: TIR domain-containing protein [unclassified Streptomyces]ODA75677.1 D-inositol-3-phosphate glycosyltransferase [Streptomyces sp. AVP053U2]
MRDGTAHTAEGQVFISYAGPDRTWAEWTAWTLQEQGIRVMLDLWDWRTGERFDERLTAAAAGNGVLVLLLSPDYLTSPHARTEWTTVLAAAGTRQRLLPVEVEPLPVAGLPPELHSIHRLQIFGLPEEEASEQLVLAVLEAVSREAERDRARRAADGGVPGTPEARPVPRRMPEQRPEAPGPARRPGGPAEPGRKHRPVRRPRRPAGPPSGTGTPPRLPGTGTGPRVSNVPADPPGVPDRESLLQQLRLQLNTTHLASLSFGRGPDGVDAVDVAREYAARFGSQYDLIWWVDAGDADEVRTSYAELAGRLGLTVDGEPGAVAEALFARLADLPRRLIVFEGAAGPGLLAGLVPPEPGHLLVVSRHPGWLEGAHRYRGPAPSPGGGDDGLGHPEPSRPLRVLAVATEWASRLGGLSTFNRCLCRALAAAGAQVYCLVPRAGREEEADAKRHGVHLVEAQVPPVWTGDLSLLRRPEKLPVVPDVILGHGRVTGPAAQLLRDQHYGDAQLVHIIHMLPYEIEFLKEDRADDPAQRADERTEVELALAGSADHAAVVGPFLHNKFARHFPGQEPFSTTLLCVHPGFDAGAGTRSGAWAAEPRPVPAGDPAVLVFGRAEDVRLKGLDLAAQALGRFVRRTCADRKLDFVVRGLAPGQSGAELREHIDRHAGSGNLTVHIKPYRTDSRVLASDLTSASLVLLPSRSEGFGLSAAEAIAAGTPVLVSDASGIGLLLRETLGREEAAHHVVETRGGEQDAERWSQAVERVLGDRRAAFHRAARLREQLAESHTWQAAAASLLGPLRDRGDRGGRQRSR